MQRLHGSEVSAGVPVSESPLADTFDHSIPLNGSPPAPADATKSDV
jgi:hypothetical protein